MSDPAVDRSVRSALAGVTNPRTRRSVLDSGNVRGVEVGESGQVTVTLVLRPDEPASLESAVRQAVEGAEGVRSARVQVMATAPPRAGRPDRGQRPGSSPRPTGARPGPGPAPGGRSLPIMGQGGGGHAPGAGAAARGAAGGAGARAATARGAASRHPSEAERMSGVRYVLAVSSGKGGVGKSTVSTNLAAAWAKEGHRVGLMDADIYGPDIPTMFGVHERPRMSDDHVLPLEAHGVKLMSLGFLVDEDTPAIWRGPIIMGVVRQFLEQVEWGELDYLIVDLPPGTGDAQLSLCQLVKLDGAVMVTTPQDVAVGGVLKGIRMFQKLEVPVLGVVENMRGFACPECGTVHEIFGTGGGEKLAASLDLPFLGAVPLGTAVREEGDRGVPTVIGRPESPEGRALAEVARATAEQLPEREATVVGSS